MLDRLGGWLRRLTLLLTPNRDHAEIDAELAFHLELRAEELRREGMSPEAARREARRRLGNRALVTQDRREAVSFRALESVARDVRLTLRSLSRIPAFTVAALVTLGLGIGGTTAIFSLVHAALLAPLPYPEAERLVNLTVVAREASGESNRLPWSYPKLAGLRSVADFADAVAGYGTDNVTLLDDGPAERLVIELASAGYLELLGARPVRGRLYGPAEDSIPGANPVVVLSDRLWKRRFGADSSVIGKPIILNDLPFTVIGVLDSGFRSLSGAPDLWTPLAMAPPLTYPEILTEAGNHWLGAVARLRPGASAESVDRRLAALEPVLSEQFRAEGGTARWTGEATPLDRVRVDPTTRRATLMLLGAVGLLLLIANANVAGLLLVRATARGREIAVRIAVGAGSGTLIRQLVIEGLVLSTLGGLVGLMLARFAVQALVGLSPAVGGAPGGLTYLFDASTVRIGGPVLLFTLLVTGITGILVGLAPVRRVRSVSVAEVLKGNRSGGKGAPRRSQAILIGVETALAVILLIGAGLMIRSFARLSAVDVGYSADRVLTFRIAPGDRPGAAATPMELKRRVLEDLRGLPGIVAAGVNSCAPLTGACSSSATVPRDGRGPAEIGVHSVDDGYFEALRIPLAAGRFFGTDARPGGPRVVIVNETAAKRLWPGEDPIGKELAIANWYFAGGDSTARVIGVVGDVRYGAAEAPAGLDAYLPALQRSPPRAMFFVRAGADPAGLVGQVREIVRRIDPTLPIFAVRSLNDIAATATARSRFLTVVLGVLSTLALTLAAVGVYGVVAFAVRQRTREIGIRIAIGAVPGRLVRMLVGQGVRPVVVGVAIGLAVAAVLGRALRGLLYQVGPRDGISFGAAVVALVIAATGAAWVAARRAARTDPVTALASDG